MGVLVIRHVPSEARLIRRAALSRQIQLTSHQFPNWYDLQHGNRGSEIRWQQRRRRDANQQVAGRIMRTKAAGTMSPLSCRRWATRPTSSSRWLERYRRIRTAASSTCCCRRGSGFRWRCCRWRFASSAAMRSVSPAANPASLRTTATSTPGSWRCDRSGCRTNLRGDGWS